MAFPVEHGWEHSGALIRQRAPGTVEVSLQVPESAAERAARQVRRILSLDVDGRGFPALGRVDPVVAARQARFPGLRPVLFPSPYEAACWAIIGNGIAMAQAARIKQRIAERHGAPVEVAGRRLVSFPEPEVLLGLGPEPGLPAGKIERLRSVARAARDGLLDAESLRALEPEQAMARLQRLPGIGPFSAQLILIRGAGRPDVFPLDEPRVLNAMRAAYGCPEATPAALARIAEGWRPYRSWVVLLLRVGQN